jgi:hypothetical protein
VNDTNLYNQINLLLIIVIIQPLLFLNNLFHSKREGAPLCVRMDLTNIINHKLPVLIVEFNLRGKLSY